MSRTIIQIIDEIHDLCKETFNPEYLDGIESYCFLLKTAVNNRNITENDLLERIEKIEKALAYQLNKYNSSEESVKNE